MLAVLALAEGASVSTTDLIDTLWPDGPPRHAIGALQSHVSRLRGQLGPLSDRISAGEHGYRLRLEPGELDLHAARDGLETARSIADDDPVGASKVLAEVRQLWRASALSEFDHEVTVTSRRVVLDELRRDIDELRVACALRAGDLDGAIRAATVAAADDPLSEALAQLRMEALAAAGRRADALRVGAELRRRLRDELGVEPTGRLAELERTIASGAPTTMTGTPPATATNLPSLEPGSVPVPTTPLVGRDAESGAVRRLLDTERLVTVVGVGGVGKTRLAADVARRHDHDTHWVTFAALDDPDDLPRALAQSLGLETARGDVLDACTRLLAPGRRLLVLDNCEHVLDQAADAVMRLLRGCSGLTILATSRQRLGLATECTFRLGPLALPDPASPHPERSPAFAVFLDRARRVQPGFDTRDVDIDATVAILRRLDGVPLAIELAASRLSSLDIGDLRDRLDRSLDLLQGRISADDRHRTLRATLDWSYDLLPADRQLLLRHLAVFPDGVDLATAERVAAEVGVVGDPVAALGHLVDASMLDLERGEPTRYRMLETVRAFSSEQLDAADERNAADARFLRWAEEFVVWVDATLHTHDEPLADARLRSELTNLRAAWALALRRDALDTATTLIVALDDAAQWRELPEVWTWATTLAEHPGLVDHPRRAAALAAASDFAWLQGDLERATELADAALECAVDDDGRARALTAASVARLSHGMFRSAAALALEATEISHTPEHSRMVAALATAYAGDVETAERINATVLPESGITQQAEWEYTAAELASLAQRPNDAERHYRRAIALATDVGSTFVVGIASLGLLTVLRTTARTADTLRGYRGVLEYWRQAGNWIQVWTTLRNLADLFVDLGDVDSARTLLAAADRDHDAPGVGPSAWAPPALDPEPHDEDPNSNPSRHDTVAFALAAIDRHLDSDAISAEHHDSSLGCD
jgi:predicted ATPase/DNA-binding SARP family transcriptional activator